MTSLLSQRVPLDNASDFIGNWRSAYNTSIISGCPAFSIPRATSVALPARGFAAIAGHAIADIVAANIVGAAAS